MPFAETARGQMHYKDYRKDADLTPLLLIHGAGGLYLDWHIQQRRDLQALAIDLPGHGRSNTMDGRRSVNDYALDVVAFLDALGIEQAIIAGHSMGGAIAQTLALEHPSYVKALILVGTGAKLAVNPLIINGIVENPEATAHMLMKWIFAKTAPDEYREQGAQRLLDIPTAVTQGDYIACDNFDVRERLSEITAPTLVIAGTADKMTPLALNQALVEGIPNAELATVEGGGHQMMLEQPDVVTTMMREWLEGKR